MKQDQNLGKIIKLILGILFLLIAGAFALDGLLYEGWKSTGRNLDKANLLALGETYSLDFEYQIIEVSKNAQYKKVTFPLPAIMPYVTGYVVYRDSNKEIVKFRIGDETKSIQYLPEIEWQ